MRIYGNILLRDGFFKGTITIKDGILVEVSEKKEDYDYRGTVIPTFINMHTHVGDSYYPDEPKGTLREVVGPGGLKFKILEDEEGVREGIKKSLMEMEECGVSHFVDFREGGEKGVNLLYELLKERKVHGVILGRDGLWRHADGIGISSISDIDYDFAKKLADTAHSHGKIFALHVSEDRREDIDMVLALNPTFLVHFLEASDEDILKVADAKVPVVLTPRANIFWGKIPNIPRLISNGIEVALGTDNGMIASPCMFREMEFAYRISRLFGYVAPENIIRMATVVPRRILGIVDNQMGEKASVIVFREIMSPYGIVTRGAHRTIRTILM